MTNAEIIQAFREEIERRIDAHHTHGHFCAEHEFRDVLSFISDLEKSKVSDGEGLEEEIKRYGKEEMPVVLESDLNDIARHFYDLGCRRTAEKYDEIEYNRQRAEEQPVGLVAIKPILPAALKPCIATFKEQGGSSEIPKDLAIAAESFAFRSLDEVVLYGCTLSGRRACFIAGAKWQKEQDDKELSDLLAIAHLQGAEQMKEQMMKEAVEYEVGMHGEPITITFDKYVQRARGIFPRDKVRVIIVKKED